MHGIVFGELKQYVGARLGVDAWGALLDEAGIGPKLYLAVEAYPDEELGAILGAASARSGMSTADLLFDFGAFIAPHLMRMYRMFLQPEWTALDVIEHTEERIHRMVRVDHRGSRPPYLSTTRRTANEIVVHYSSERRLCALAKGIASGIARHYGETLEIRELTCMLRGGATCEIVLRRVY